VRFLKRADVYIQAKILPSSGRMEWGGLIVLEFAQGDFNIPFGLLESRATQLFDSAVGLAAGASSAGAGAGASVAASSGFVIRLARSAMVGKVLCCAV
jgi:hypothetical protein